MRPYGLLAFQWSCHVLDAPGAPLRHLEWINSDRSWPNAAFARSVARAIGSSGTVLTWSPFESSILKTVRDELTERGLLDAELARLLALVDGTESGSSARVLDMHRLAATEYFHVGMGGRTSIKVVLDALWRSDADMRSQFFALTGKRGDPETGPYAALEPLVIAGVEQEVAEGTGAIRAYEALMFGAERRSSAAHLCSHVSRHLEIAPLWVLRTGTNLAHEPLVHESREPSACCARRKADCLRDLARGATVRVRQGIHDRSVSGFKREYTQAFGEECYAEPEGYFLELRGCQACFAAGGHDALDAAPPLLYEPEFVENAANDAIAEFGNTTHEVLDGKAKGQQPRVLDLDSIVEDSNADRSATLRIVCVRHGVNHRLADCHRWHVPALLAPNGSYIGATVRVLFYE